jgi:small basic protein
MWTILALLVGITLGVVKKDSLAKTSDNSFNVTVTVPEQTKDTVIEKKKKYY